MARYYGSIGYGIQEETKPGVWVPTITERQVYGDIMRNSMRNDKSDKVNDNLSISMKISFLSDPYALANFHLIKYATYMGAKWKVSNVEVEQNRLMLTLGGVYNE